MIKGGRASERTRSIGVVCGWTVAPADID